MSRRRYITTLISVDKRVRQLTDRSALLYTWMIPHAEEDATITADYDELAATVVPNRKGWDAGQVFRCCCEIQEQELFVEWDERFLFPPVAFYRIQSNIHVSKRRTWHPTKEDLQNTGNSGEQRETAGNSASPSPSPSPSPSKHLSNQLDDFDSFWSLYPRKEGKGQARKAWGGALKKCDVGTILSDLRRQLPELQSRERQYIKLPATWLNGECWLDEVKAPTDGYRVTDEDHARRIAEIKARF